MSSNRKGEKKRDDCNKGLVCLSHRSSFVSTINNSKTTSNSLIHQGIPIIPSPVDCNPLHFPGILPFSKGQNSKFFCLGIFLETIFHLKTSKSAEFKTYLSISIPRVKLPALKNMLLISFSFFLSFSFYVPIVSCYDLCKIRHSIANQTSTWKGFLTLCLFSP